MEVDPLDNCIVRADLDREQVSALERIARARGVALDAVITEAITEHLALSLWVATYAVRGNRPRLRGQGTKRIRRAARPRRRARRVAGG